MVQPSLRAAELTIGEYLARLASADPVPGGGSVSGVVGGFAAGLLEMVSQLSLDRPKYAPFEVTVRRARDHAEAARRRFVDLADADADAYMEYVRARKLPRETPGQVAEREEASRRAARRAAEMPLEMVRLARDTAIEVEAVAGRSNVNASSDLKVAALLLEAAARGAAENVLVNVPAVEDEAFTGRVTAEVRGLLEEVEHLSRRTSEHLGSDELREPEPAA